MKKAQLELTQYHN